jgi:uncharacterized membrane protein YfcA
LNPILPLEYISIPFYMLLMGLCQLSGIGGGGIIEPMNMAFFDFNTEMAVAVSNFLIMTCSFVRIITTWKVKSPSKPRRIATDYSVAIIMMPTALAGTQIGGILLRAAPAVIIQSLLFIVQVLLGIQAYRKAKEASERENQENIRNTSVDKLLIGSNSGNVSGTSDSASSVILP